MNTTAAEERSPGKPPRSCRLPSCPGHYERRHIVHHEPAPGAGETVFIDNVPAGVCAVCGDVLFPPETAEALDAWRDDLEAGTARAPDRTDLFHFQRAARVA
jgi:YgiT-type zinc finger domain-containing protein